MSKSSEDDVFLFVWMFQFCSFLRPLSATRFLLKSISILLWSLLHLGCAAIELTIIYLRHKDTFHKGSNIGRILDIVQVILPIAAHIILILETTFTWNIQYVMWEMIKTVEERIKLIGIIKGSFIKTYLIEMIAVFFVGLVSEATVIASIVLSNDESFARSWYFRLWSLYMVRFGIMQLIFYMDWMQCHLNVINKVLVDTKNDESKAKIMFDLKEIYSDIWLFSVQFNKRFAWSILALMINLFVTIIICFYWVLTRLYFGVLEAIFASSLICVAPVTNLIVLLYSCNHCISEANQVGPTLHGINSKVNSSIKFLVHNFSLQVKMLPISIYGWGFFTMNFPFLVDVFSACASYLLLVFSLNPGTY